MITAVGNVVPENSDTPGTTSRGVIDVGKKKCQIGSGSPVRTFGGHELLKTSYVTFDNREGHTGKLSCRKGSLWGPAAA